MQRQYGACEHARYTRARSSSKRAAGRRLHMVQHVQGQYRQYGPAASK